MDIIKLLKPTEEYSKDIMDFRQELINNNDKFDGCPFLGDCTTSKQWIDLVNKLENNPDEGFVLSSTFIAIRLCDNKIVGIIDLRHSIDHPVLSVWGGHIGYSIRPSERKKGYGKEILKLNLVNAKNLGLEEILITCNKDNIASEKIIIANGGVFQKQINVDDKTINRYYIRL